MPITAKQSGAVAFEVSLTGDKELMAKLNSLVTRDHNRIVMGALKKSSKRVLPVIKSRTPVGTYDMHATARRGTMAGALKRSYYIKRIKKNAKRVVGWRINTGRRRDLGIEGASGYYPAALEYGFRHARSGKFIPPRRFMRGPIQERGQAEIALIRRDIFIGIDRLMKRRAARAAAAIAAAAEAIE